MKFNEIIDPIYGILRFPQVINRFLLCPELLRLREIRMSNINFINFTGFSDISRYEHSLGTAYLAYKMVKEWQIDEKDKIEIIAAALFHDVATPPFGHATEAVYKRYFDFDHEKETAKIILGKTSDFRTTIYFPIYANEIPRLKEVFERLMHPKLDINNVFLYIQGKGKYGKIIKGKIDLDNIDNVIRAAYHIGLKIDKELPIKIVTNFIYHNNMIQFRFENKYLIESWLDIRNKLYTAILRNTFDLNRESILQYAIECAIQLKIMKKTDWSWTDNELIYKLSNPDDFQNENHKKVAELIDRLKLGIILKEIGLFWVTDNNLYGKIKNDNRLLESLKNKIEKKLNVEIIIKVLPDKRSRKIDDFNFYTDCPLFNKSEILNEEKDFGTNKTNLLIGIYSITPRIVKRNNNGSSVLNKDNKQIEYKSDELKNITINIIRKYLTNNKNITNFTTKLLE